MLFNHCRTNVVCQYSPRSAWNTILHVFAWNFALTTTSRFALSLPHLSIKLSYRLTIINSLLIYLLFIQATLPSAWVGICIKPPLFTVGNWKKKGSLAKTCLISSVMNLGNQMDISLSYVKCIKWIEIHIRCTSASGTCILMWWPYISGTWHLLWSWKINHSHACIIVHKCPLMWCNTHWCVQCSCIFVKSLNFLIGP